MTPLFKNIVVIGGVVAETPGIVALNAFVFLLERSVQAKEEESDNNGSLSSCGRELHACDAIFLISMNSYLGYPDASTLTQSHSADSLDATRGFSVS